MNTVAFLVPIGVELFDIAGPVQVLSSLADLTGHPKNMIYLGEQETVVSHQGLPLHLQTTWPQLSTEDVLVVPGFHNAAVQRPFTPATLDVLIDYHAAGVTILSVCAGAFVLAEAELLNGRRATTHHKLQDILAKRYPRINVIKNVLYVGGSGVYTSAGIASGVDLTLHVVEQQYGARIAAQIARTMVVYVRRNGTMEQHSVMLQHRDHIDDVVHQTLDLLDAHFAQTFTLAELARLVSVSPRTLTRLFKQHTGVTPSQYQRMVRLEHATTLLSQGMTQEEAAHRVGFADARSLRNRHR